VKVVLFCGGLGMRMREYAENVPKPMVSIGYRPILWHLMKYYAHWGHKDFILCLGYRGDVIKDYFLNYEECVSNDFILSEGGRCRELLNRDTTDWRITFVDTGLNANIGERLVAVRDHLRGEDVFLANYADGLTDMPLPDQLSHFQRSGCTASFLSASPHLSYHFVETNGDGRVTRMPNIQEAGLRINAGFFVFRQEVFSYIREGEELVEEPFKRMIDAGELVAFNYNGFWMPMDTAKDRQRFDELHTRGRPPWDVWNGRVNSHSHC
jgi:glucose-1-phosphate cytidylyltransferase